jgi:hypothetical protein
MNIRRILKIMAEQYEAKVIVDKVIGYLEKGTFTGTRILPNGRTAKVTVNDYVANGNLTSPKDINDPILIGAVIREETHYSEDNRAKVIEVGKRIRTYESIEYAESFIKQKIEDVSPKAQ